MLKITRVLAWTIIILGILLAHATAWAAPADGQNLFEKRCSACHKLPDPDQPPPQGWAEQLNLMAPLARLKPTQKQSILDYLQTHSQQASMDAALDEDRVLFDDKCGHCHTLDRVLLSPLRGESLSHVINRMQSRSGTDWLSDQDVERVLSYLDTVPRGTTSTAPLSTDATPADIFSARCSACHTLERIFQKLGENSNAADFWSHTVSRMRGKAPQWMSETEAGEILKYLQFISTTQQ